jgi:molybdate transport system substrate-binding protein
MLNGKMKKWALGLSTALALIYSPAYAATTIKIGVASGFGNAASDLASAFQAYYAQFGSAYAYNVIVTVSSAQALEAKVIAGGTSAPPFDLFLSTDKAEPHDLVKNYPSLIVGTPFKFAKDFLLLYSTSVDIHAGLPYPFTTNFVIPAPTLSNYGEAASEVLSSAPWYVNPTTIPSGNVFTSPTAGTSLAAINAGTYAYGFIAKSGVCHLDPTGAEVYPAGSFHHEYRPGSDAHPSEKLVLKGIEIASLTRTTAQATELSDFIAFLTGGTDSLGNIPTTGQDVIQGYCFKTP